MTIIAIMAGFSFGYCLLDMIQNYRSERKLNQFLKDFNIND